MSNPNNTTTPNIRDIGKNLDNLKKKYDQTTAYEFSKFMPTLENKQREIGCSLNNPSTYDTRSPDMNLISDNQLYTADSCKMEASLKSSSINFKNKNNKSSIYYSLVENTPEDTKNGLYKCYLSNETTAPISIKNTGYYKINLQEKILYKITNINKEDESPENYAKLDFDGSFKLYSKDGKMLEEIFSAPSVNTLNANIKGCYYTNYTNEIDAWATANPKMIKCVNNEEYPDKATPYWNNVGKNKQDKNLFCKVVLKTYGDEIFYLGIERWGNKTIYKHDRKAITGMPTGQPNYNWYMQKNPHTVIVDATNPSVIINSTTPLVQVNSKYKITIDKTGNLVVLYSISPCNKNGPVSFSNENGKFLNSINVPYTYNNLFYNEKQKKNLTKISSHSEVLSTKTHHDFHKYTGYAPLLSDLKNEKNNTKTGCENTCINDPACDYYYHYVKNGRSKCITSTNTTDNIIPPLVFNDVKQYNKDPNNIKSSDLYVKNKKVELPINLMSAPTIKMNNYAEFNKYSDYNLSDKLITNKTTLGYLNEKEVQDVLALQQKILGNSGKTGFQNIEGYESIDCSKSPEGCIDNINNKKLGALQNLHNGYYTNSLNAGSNYSDLGDNIKNYNQEYIRLLIHPKNKYEMNPFNSDGTPINFLPKTKTIVDAANDDINEMIMQQNNMYILGTIASATLIITAILLGSSD